MKTSDWIIGPLYPQTPIGSGSSSSGAVAVSGANNPRDALPWPLDATELNQGWRSLLGVLPYLSHRSMMWQGGRAINNRWGCPTPPNRPKAPSNIH